MAVAESRCVGHERRLRSVNQALSFGIPLVTAGRTEDKADVNARVAWPGAGIDLATNEPTPPALRKAIRTVLDTPQYRARALSMAEAFHDIDTRSEILRIVHQVVHAPGKEDVRLPDAACAKRQPVNRMVLLDASSLVPTH